MICLLLLVLAIGIFAFTQRDNIEAIILGIKYGQDEISQLQTDAKTDFAENTGIDLEFVEEIAGQITPDGTPIQEQPTTEQSDSQAAADSVDGAPGNQAVVPQAPASDGTSNGATTGSSTGTSAGVSAGTGDSQSPHRNPTEIELLLARFYALQASYVSQLEGIKENAYTQYKELPKEERNKNAKIRLGRQAVSDATVLEAECDTLFNALLKELRTALTEAGLDQSLASEIRRYYASEKSLLKAQYMSKYKEYLS